MSTIKEIAALAAKARKAGAAFESAVSARDAAIAQAWANGLRRQDISDAAGLTVQRISQIADAPRKRGRPRKDRAFDG